MLFTTNKQQEMQITLTISKSGVMSEVAQTTDYTGAKIVGDNDAYERISTVDEDEDELERFWRESRADVAQTFVSLLVSEEMDETDADKYNLVLNVSGAFETAQLPSMEIGLFSSFVNSIVGKWFAYTNKGESGSYSDRGSALLEDVREKAFYKKKPIRPTYEVGE